MKPAGRTILLGILMLWISVLVCAEPVSQLHPTDYVNDFAHVLDQTTIAQLDNICQQIDQKAHAQNDYNGAVLLLTSRVANVIAQDAGVQLTGAQARAPTPPMGISVGGILLLVIVILVVLFTPLRRLIFWWLLFGG